MVDQEKAIAAVVRAIRDPGPVPSYHYEVMRRHRQEWPSLWAALDALLRAGTEAAHDAS